MDTPSYLALTSSAVVSFVACLGLILTKNWHGRFTLDGTQGIQKFHTVPTPRVGGIGVLMGLIWGLGVIAETQSQLLKTMLIASIPVFVLGMAEDLTKRVSPRARLVAAFASAVIACWLSGVSLTRLDVWGFDSALQWLPVSVLFTAFAVAGVTNAINIIDGCNGLAAGVCLIGLATLGLMAYGAGDHLLVGICLILAAATSGFLLLNFPFGKIFLGDGGAYLLGFTLAWSAVMLPVRNPSISPWAGLLACGYPVLEVLFSMARRYIKRSPAGHPDRLHLHSLIKSRITHKRLPSSSATLKNAAVSPIVWALAAIPATLALVFRHNTQALILGALACALAYTLVYRRLVRFHW